MIAATPSTSDSATSQESGSEAITRFPAMASTVTLRVLDPGPQAREAMTLAREHVRAIERTCTRFDPGSDLMRANARGRRWTRVSSECLDVLRRAYDAYLDTRGAFDPRTLESLQAWGYDRTWEQVRPVAGGMPRARKRPGAWRPDFDDGNSRVRVGSRPVDLGGIGKGVAVSQAMDILRAHGSSVLVEAGGDLAVHGSGPRGSGWRVWVEDPFGGDQPAAVWEVTDSAVATSSLRRRRWMVGDRQVHHLVDPRTGLPAESGLMSVTVVHADAATAEVWTKVGFLAGQAGIRRTFDEAGVPAVWIDDDGRVRYSRAAVPLLAWKVSRVPG